MLVGQLAWLLAFSAVQYRRGGLTFDFSVWNQARWLISHGHLDPYSTVMSMPFWQVDGNWLMWPLALGTVLPPHGLWLLWVQDLAVFGSAWIVVSWILRAAGAQRSRHAPRLLDGPWRSSIPAGLLALLAAVLLCANPWIYSTAAFDFHWEAVAGFFTLLTAWDLARGKTRRAWIWVALTLATQQSSALYVVGVGAAGIFALRADRGRRTAVLVMVSGLAWLGLMTGIHANRASYLQAAYGYLAGPGAASPSLGQMAWGAVTHASRPLGQIWSNRLDFWANLLPAGLLGVLNPWALGVTVVVLVPDFLWTNHLMAQPSFQNYPVYPFVTLGSVLVLARLGRKHAPLRHASAPIAVAMAGASIAWAWAWLPLYPRSWLRVTPSAARVLARVRDLIPANAEIVTTNGISGRLSEHRDFYVKMNVPSGIPLHGEPVYFVIPGNQGIAYNPLGTKAVLSQVAALNPDVVLHDDGIWVLRWVPPPGAKYHRFPGPSAGLAAWTLNSTVGAPDYSGMPSGWHIQGTGSRGFVVWGDYWSVAPGRYIAAVKLSSDGPVTVEVSSSDHHRIVASLSVPPSATPETVSFPFSVPPVAGGGSSGVTRPKYFRIQTPAGKASPLVEVRVVNPGDPVASVYTVAVRRASS